MIYDTPETFEFTPVDARRLPLANGTVDVVVTSPPYWRKRDYDHPDQIGWEDTPEDYAKVIAVDCLREWARVLRPHGSVFLNVGDTYHRKSLVGVPFLIEQVARQEGWKVRNRIVWTKTKGVPDPASDRLTSRHEYVLHLVRGDRYFYDLAALGEHLGEAANPGDVWAIDPERGRSAHLATFPEELVRRMVVVGCPIETCTTCGQPRRRIIDRTFDLNPSRPQALRAMQLARDANLTNEHLAAVRSVGISDAGKAMLMQDGTGRNSQRVMTLAAEAKAVLGGYSREFTMSPKVTVGWTSCGHSRSPGVVLDPFVGSGTTVRVARSMGRTACGYDLVKP